MYTEQSEIKYNSSNLCVVTKAMPGRKFISLNTYVKKKKI
jgi:hypothetical protein